MTKTPDRQRRDAKEFYDLQKLLAQQALDALLRTVPQPQPENDQ
jgi:hypothetical protein